MIAFRGDRELLFPAGPNRPVFSVILPPLGGIKVTSPVTFMPREHFDALSPSPPGVPIYWTRQDDRTILFHPVPNQDYEIAVRDWGGVTLPPRARPMVTMEQYGETLSDQDLEEPGIERFK